mgnify:FL=1
MAWFETTRCTVFSSSSSLQPSIVCGRERSAKMNINTSKSAVARGRWIRTLRMGLIPYTTPHYRDFSLMCLAPAGWVGKKKPKIRSTTHANVEGGSSPRINSMSELWVEKHRPQSVTQIKGQAAVVQRLGTYAGSKNFPHLLFAGPPGTCLLYTSPSPRDPT